MNKIISFILAILPLTMVFSQEKKVIDETTYKEWNIIKETKLSPSGKYIAYTVVPYKGDGYLYIQSTNENHKDSIYKGYNASFHHQDKYMVFKVSPGYDTIRALKLAKEKKEKFPKDTLCFYWIEKDSFSFVSKVNSFKIAEEGDWMAYWMEEDLQPNRPKYTKKQERKIKKGKFTPVEKKPTSGKTLVVFNPLTGEKNTIHQVTEYEFNKDGTQLVYISSLKGKSDTLSLYNLNLKSQEITLIYEKQLAIKSLNFDEKGEQLVFLAASDTNKRKTFDLMYWKTGLPQAKIMADTLSKGFPENWTVSEHKSPYFSENGVYIYFGTNEKVKQDPKDTLLDTEKAKVDVWSWTDKHIQPQQLKNLKVEERRTYLAKYELLTDKIIQIENETLKNVEIDTKHNAEFGLGIDNENHKKQQSWEFPWKTDYYYVDLKNGESKIIKEEIAYGGEISPKGEYFVWYNGEDSTWWSKNILSGEEFHLTKNVKENFASDNNGNPFLTYPFGSTGWILDKNSEKIIIHSEFDVWIFDPSGKQTALNLTQTKEKKIVSRFYPLERDSMYFSLENNLIKGFHKKTKDEFVQTIQVNNGTYTLSEPLLLTNHTFMYVSKAKKSDVIVYRKSNFYDYPDLFITDLSFQNSKKISNANPQQKEYNWGTVELVSWKSFKGLELDGLLYKPENFDSTKSYPMIVYFYEEYSDDIHRYYAPKPTASVVFPTEYVSNGYIVFIPDIKYTPGYPAKSAYDCIVSGTDYLTQKYVWIDPKRMGLQGQSWGGYQTAQLITMTNKYACGMAGAPVSNMFSAYGGVRWGSGMSRMFQYERTQSRIGCTIWECPELYIENSPIFGLPKVQTPLLIMHNDEDGAVPWYQGIEMYMGLRRLDKPVWLLNYNGDDHNLMQDANREDLSIRMKQFFDYYLQGKPMPLWMKEGVPATEKGNPDFLK